MKNIKKILQHEDTIKLVAIYCILFSIAFTCLYFSNKYERVCFPKSQFTELEKSIKTNKRLRGTYDGF